MAGVNLKATRNPLLGMIVGVFSAPWARDLFRDCPFSNVVGQTHDQGS